MAQKDYLDYSGLQKFFNKLKTYISGAIGDITPASIGASATGHSHSAGDIKSGTLSVSRGGTGKGSVTASNFLVGNGTGALQEKTPAEVLALIGAAGAANLFSATLTSGSWSNGTQTVSNSSIKTGDYIYIVFADASSESAYSAAGVKAQDVTTSGSMTFTCDSAPSANLTVNILMLEVS